MPSGNQSLISGNPDPYTSFTGNGNLYKSMIDACLSIDAQVAGMLYVTPNSPVGMSVVVDTQFSILQQGTGFYSNSAGSPAVVSLTAPGSGTYYATIYYDEILTTCGAVYGAIGGVPILPDGIWQKPLAVVSITSTTTSISVGNITDIRTMPLSGTLVKRYGSLGTSQALSCYAASSVYVYANLTASISITLSFLRAGANVGMFFQSTAGSFTIKVAANMPSGTTYTTSLVSTSGTVVNLTTTGVALTTSTGLSLSMAYSDTAGSLVFTAS